MIKTTSTAGGQNGVNTTEYGYRNDTLMFELSYRDYGKNIYGEDTKEAGKKVEYIYENGKLKGYRRSEIYFPW